MFLLRLTSRFRAAWVWILLTAAAGSMGIAEPACARREAGVEFADSVQVEGVHFRLNGVAVYRKFGVRVLAAGLWLERPNHEAATILHDDQPRRYVTHFLHSVGAKRIRKAWAEGLDANSPNAGPEVEHQFQELSSWIHDFKSGEELTVTYVPGRGSSVEINSKRVGSISGKPFADAYFALAIGTKPGLGTKFRKKLLGG